MSRFKISKKASDIIEKIYRRDMSLILKQTTSQKTSGQNIACVEDSKRGREGCTVKWERRASSPKPFPISRTGHPNTTIIIVETLFVFNFLNVQFFATYGKFTNAA